jgi:hypothetical protein
MIQRILTMVLMAVVYTSFAQYNETIRTGRPGQSIGPFTLGGKILQIQSGLDYFGYKNSGTDFKGSGYLQNTVIRYGITEPFEVSALLEYKTEEITTGDVHETIDGWSAVDIGMRYHIYDGRGLVPSVGFQVRWRVPNIGGDYEIDQWAPRFIFVTGQRLSDKLSLATNWGASWNGMDGVPRGNYVFNLSYSLSNKLGVFIENYGNVLKSNWNTYFDGGFAYLVNNDFQLDLLGGYGENEGMKEYFISAGISWRTKRK